MHLKQVVSVGLSVLLAQAMALPQPYLQNGVLLSTRDDTVAAQPAQDQAQNQQAEANVQAVQAQQADSNKQVDQTQATAQNAQADAAKAAAPAADATQNQPQQNDAAQLDIGGLVSSFVGGGSGGGGSGGGGGGGSGFSIPFLSSSGMGSGATPPSSSSQQTFWGGLTDLVNAAGKLKSDGKKPDDSYTKALEDWQKALQGKKDDDKDAYTKWYEDYEKQWKDYYDKLYGKKDDDDDKDPYKAYKDALKAWKKAYEGGGDDDDGGSIDGNTLKFKIKDLEFWCYWYVPYPGNAQLACNYYYA